MLKLQNQHLFIAIPLLDEYDNIHSLLNNLKSQSIQDFTVYFCVNQPDEWWEDNQKIQICNRNIDTLDFLNKYSNDLNFSLKIIDKCSKGNGWNNKKLGVGWARKTIIDRIDKEASDNDIIISLDGDTSFAPTYFQSIISNLNKNREIDVISVPYYHPLNKDEEANRAILRYEIYMRVYLLNLIKIQSPYSFTALGSAIAFRIKALRKIGGFTPKKSGEDFYFLQKMVKYKPIGIWNEESVKPEARFSNRVFFGTGPAMIKGRNGLWDSYPIYPVELFKQIKEFYSLIPILYQSDIKTPIDSFLKHNSIDYKILWSKLRKNNKDLQHFTKAIHDYFDGLRILQYLKYKYKEKDDEANLIEFLHLLNKHFKIKNINIDKIDFKSSTISDLNEIRDYLCKVENSERKRIENLQWKTD